MGTTYRLTEHFHYWTKHALINASLQPEQFVEIGEALAQELGIKAGDKVKGSSKRGFIKAEIVSYEDLVSLGSIAEARAHGRVRMEGKDYVMQDGDVVEFRFNV